MILLLSKYVQSLYVDDHLIDYVAIVLIYLDVCYPIHEYFIQNYDQLLHNYEVPSSFSSSY